MKRKKKQRRKRPTKKKATVKCDCCKMKMNRTAEDPRQQTFHHYYPKKLRHTEGDNMDGTYVCKRCHEAFHKKVDFSKPTENKEFYKSEYLKFRSLKWK